MRSQTIARIVIFMLAVSAFPLKSAVAENTIAECAPAQGFVDVPSPPIDRSDEMVSRTETILVDRPLGTVLTVVNRPLKDALRPTGSLPGVTGTPLVTFFPHQLPGPGLGGGDAECSERVQNRRGKRDRFYRELIFTGEAT